MDSTITCQVLSLVIDKRDWFCGYSVFNLIILYNTTLSRALILISVCQVTTFVHHSHLLMSKCRGGEWSFQKYGSRKIFLKFLGSRSLDFCADVSVSESRIFAR